MQATPSGGKVEVRSRLQGNEIRWWICDNGKGIGQAEGVHLFDPFYCGRQAGRGLGLGLPRAAGRRSGGGLAALVVAQWTGDDLSCSATPGQSSGTGEPGCSCRSILRERVDVSANKLGTLCTGNHHVGDRVAIGAEEGHVERFGVIPVMALQTSAATTPGAASGAGDQAQHLTQSRGISCRPCPDAARSQTIEADLDMPGQTGKERTPVVPLSSLHGSQPVVGSPGASTNRRSRAC